MDDKVKKLIVLGNTYKALVYDIIKEDERLAFMEKINNPVFIEFKNKLNMLTAKWDTLCKELEDETLQFD